MKNPWTTTRVPVSVSKDAETIKEHEKTIKDLERTIKILKEENSYLKSSFEEGKDELFPPASGQKTIAEEKRDKDLGAVRSVLSRRIKDEIIEKTLEGCFSVTIYARELVRFDDEILKTYNHDDIIEPIIKALREEGYQAGQSTTAFGGFLDGSYFVSWD